MKKILLGLLLIFGMAYAELINVPISPKIVESGIKIIDIRTKPEWQETGIIKGSIPITFFDERGKYDVPKFLEALNSKIKKGEKFAIVCRTGHRTGVVSKFLSQNGYNVVNLEGGIKGLLKQGYKLVKYEDSK